MEAQGLIQCLDSFLRKVSEFLNEVLAAETLSAPAALKKLELIDNLDFIKFYHDPVSFIKCLVQKSSAADRAAPCKCRSRGFCVLPAACPRLLRARLDAFSAELRARLSAATVTTVAASLLVRRRDLVEPDLEGWLLRRLDGSSGGGGGGAADDAGGCKCYAVLCDTFLALFRSADDIDEVAAPAIVVSDKYVLEESPVQGGSQFTVCGAGERYTFACKSSDDAQKWIDFLTRAARLRLHDLVDALKSPTAAATAVSMGATRASACRGDAVIRQPLSKQPQREQTDRQRQPPEGAADEPSSAAPAAASAAAIGVPPGPWRPLCEAAAARVELANPMPSEALITATPRPGAGGWSLDLGGFAISARRPSMPKRSRARVSSSEPRHSVSSSKSSLSLHHSSTTALLGSHRADGSPPPPLPKSASSDGVALGRSATTWSVRDHLIKKPPPPLGGVRLRAKRSTSSSAAAAVHRRARSLVIENGDGRSSAVPTDLTSLSLSGGGAAAAGFAPAARPRSVGARISQSASALFSNLAAAGARAAQPQQKQHALTAQQQQQLLSIPSAAILRPTSSERAKALLGGCANVEIEGCLHHRGLLKWSKLQCAVVGGTLLGFKDAAGGSGSGALAEQPALQLELRGCVLVEATPAADDSKAKRAHAFKLYPPALAAGGSSAKALHFAADAADDLDRWLVVLRGYTGPKTATLREPTADMLSGVEQMIELGSEHGGSMAAIVGGPQHSRSVSDGSGVTADVTNPGGAETALAKHAFAENTVDSRVDGGDIDGDAKWPAIFSDDADLLDGLDFAVAGLSLPTTATAATALQEQRQQQQQGITLPSSPSNARTGGGCVIIETDEDGPQRRATATAEVEFQPDTFVWLSPASSVRSARSSSSMTTATGDDPVMTSSGGGAAPGDSECHDDLQLRQMSLQRRKNVLQNVIREKERLQAVMLSEKSKYAKSSPHGSPTTSGGGGGRRRVTTQLSSSSSDCSIKQVNYNAFMKADESSGLPKTAGSGSPTGSKHFSSANDITAMKQHMEGLKSKMRCIDKGLRQSIDPSLMLMFRQGNDGSCLPGNELHDADEQADAVSGSAIGERHQSVEAAGTQSDRGRVLHDGHAQDIKGKHMELHILSEALTASDNIPTKSVMGAGTSLTKAAGVAASAPAARADAVAMNGPTLYTSRNLDGNEATALTSWSDLRSLIDSLDAAEPVSSSAGLGHMIVLGDV